MPVFESSRKVQSFGSSLALTLPAMFVKANEVEKGFMSKVYYGLDGVLVITMVDDDKAKEGLVEIANKIAEKCMKNKEKNNNIT
jgi:antitoxin component of MazEF toxin-antitoxin module